MKLAPVLCSLILAGCASPAAFHAARPATPVSPGLPAHWAPYAPLVGTWDVVGHDGGAPVAVARFRWGPGHAYLWHSIATLEGGSEVPHLEGLLAWNGATRRLDLLFVLDLAAGTVQEQGTMSMEGDGTLVRAHVLIDAAGRKRAFRQAYRVESDDRIATSVLREADGGWVASFPGSDRLVMVRR